MYDVGVPYLMFFLSNSLSNVEVVNNVIIYIKKQLFEI